MSGIRPGTCAAPGPRDTHCQDYLGHRYTCHDHTWLGLGGSDA